MRDMDIKFIRGSYKLNITHAKCYDNYIYIKKDLVRKERLRLIHEANKNKDDELYGNAFYGL